MRVTSRRITRSSSRRRKRSRSKCGRSIVGDEYPHHFLLQPSNGKGENAPPQRLPKRKRRLLSPRLHPLLFLTDSSHRSVKIESVSEDKIRSFMIRVIEHKVTNVHFLPYSPVSILVNNRSNGVFTWSLPLHTYPYDFLTG